MTDPTRSTYDGLTEAYDFFNERLFADRLPRCLLDLGQHFGDYDRVSLAEVVEHTMQLGPVPTTPRRFGRRYAVRLKFLRRQSLGVGVTVLVVAHFGRHRRDCPSIRENGPQYP